MPEETTDQLNVEAIECYNQTDIESSKNGNTSQVRGDFLVRWTFVGKIK